MENLSENEDEIIKYFIQEMINPNKRIEYFDKNIM